MKLKQILFYTTLPLLMFACEKSENIISKDGDTYSKGEYESSADDGLSNSESNPNQAQAGVVTAGEWCDLNNWSFWGSLINKQDYYTYTDNWSFYTNHRIAVRVTNNGTPVCGAKVQLKNNGTLVWTAITNNKGECNLWYSLFEKTSNTNDDSLPLSISINGTDQIGTPTITAWKDEEVKWNEYSADASSVEGTDIAFIVDATGSMMDEIDFLKKDVQDIINRIEQKSNIRTAALFYRDEDDEYLTRSHNFTSDISATAKFINEQDADGGGDWPEAVHTAFEKSLQELSWKSNARVKIAFWLLDAPPHAEASVITSIQKSIKTYAAQGIRMIPIAASGIDKETEILLRNYAIVTNGTYVFITNDSGIGNDHIEATVGEYKVELLNELMIRLINEYTE